MEHLQVSRPYQALVFDLDGTAVNTIHNMDALQEAYELYSGKTLSREDIVICYGLPAKETLLYLGLSGAEEEKFLSTWMTVFDKYRHLDRLFDGFYDTLLELKKAGIRLGINTSRVQQEIQDLHTYIPEDFVSLCDVVVSCDIVERPKPAPDSLLYFLQQTGLKAEDTLYLGDSIFDSQCAQNSGIDFALAMWGTTRPEIHAQYHPQKPQDLIDLVLGKWKE